MTKKLDFVVIGTGSAGSSVASKRRAAGWRVAIVDSRHFGGTCALRGCDPKKVLVGAADLTDWFRRMEGKGIQAKQARIDWTELMQFKRSFTCDSLDPLSSTGARTAGRTAPGTNVTPKNPVIALSTKLVSAERNPARRTRKPWSKAEPRQTEL